MFGCHPHLPDPEKPDEGTYSEARVRMRNKEKGRTMGIRREARLKKLDEVRNGSATGSPNGGGEVLMHSGRPVGNCLVSQGPDTDVRLTKTDQVTKSVLKDVGFYPSNLQVISVNIQKHRVAAVMGALCVNPSGAIVICLQEVCEKYPPKKCKIRTTDGKHRAVELGNITYFSDRHGRTAIYSTCKPIGADSKVLHNLPENSGCQRFDEESFSQEATNHQDVVPNPVRRKVILAEWCMNYFAPPSFSVCNLHRHQRISPPNFVESFCIKPASDIVGMEIIMGDFNTIPGDVDPLREKLMANGFTNLNVLATRGTRSLDSIYVRYPADFLNIPPTPACIHNGLVSNIPAPGYIDGRRTGTGDADSQDMREGRHYRRGLFTGIGGADAHNSPKGEVNNRVGPSERLHRVDGEARQRTQAPSTSGRSQRAGGGARQLPQAPSRRQSTDVASDLVDPSARRGDGDDDVMMRRSIETGVLCQAHSVADESGNIPPRVERLLDSQRANGLHGEVTSVLPHVERLLDSQEFEGSHEEAAPAGDYDEGEIVGYYPDAGANSREYGQGDEDETSQQGSSQVLSLTTPSTHFESDHSALEAQFSVKDEGFTATQATPEPAAKIQVNRITKGHIMRFWERYGERANFHSTATTVDEMVSAFRKSVNYAASVFPRSRRGFKKNTQEGGEINSGRKGTDYSVNIMDGAADEFWADCLLLRDTVSVFRPTMPEFLIHEGKMVTGRKRICEVLTKLWFADERLVHDTATIDNSYPDYGTYRFGPENVYSPAGRAVTSGKWGIPNEVLKNLFKIAVYRMQLGAILNKASDENVWPEVLRSSGAREAHKGGEPYRASSWRPVSPPPTLTTTGGRPPWDGRWNSILGSYYGTTLEPSLCVGFLNVMGKPPVFWWQVELNSCCTLRRLDTCELCPIPEDFGWCCASTLRTVIPNMC